MIAQSAERVVSQFVDAGVLLVLVPLLVAARLFGPFMARWWRTTTLIATAALGSLGGVLAFTLGVRAITEGRREFVGSDFSWLTDSSVWRAAFDLDPSWLLNVLLFVPAGVFLSVALRRPIIVFLGLASMSFAIETIQSLTRVGTADLRDLVANTIGAAVGVVLASATVHRRAGNAVPLSGAEQRSIDIRANIAAIIAIAVVGGATWFGVGAVADHRQDRLADELTAAFDGTTAADVAAEAASDPGFDRLMLRGPSRPDYIGEVGDAGMFEGRWSTEFLGLHRCVIVRWTDDELTLRETSGRTCRRFQERPLEN